MQRGKNVNLETPHIFNTFVSILYLFLLIKILLLVSATEVDHHGALTDRKRQLKLHGSLYNDIE